MRKKIASLKLSTRIIATMLVVLTVTVAVNYVVFVRGYQNSALNAMVDQAASFTALADETKNYTSNLFNHGAFDIEGMTEEIKTLQEQGNSYKESKLFQSLPIIAGWSAAAGAAEREDIQFNITAFDARNKDNEPEPGSFQEELLRDLSAQYKSTGDEVLYRVNQDSNSLVYLRAVKLTDDCMRCHGDPQGQYATADGRDLLGFPMENWNVGDMHGAYEVVMPLDGMQAQVGAFMANGLAWTAPLGIGGIFVFMLLLRGMFAKPIKNMIDRVRDIAEGEGDLTARIPVNGRDEIGMLSGYINGFIENMQSMIKQISGSAREVAAASTEIAASADQMAGSIQQQANQVTQISASVEELSGSAMEVAQQAGDAQSKAKESGSVAVEGGTVVEDTIKGMHAIDESVEASAKCVDSLGKRGEAIGEIVSVINDIADQTNLLALNAAIEAARAGEHGRGFAVVADEVRKLADRTTSATEEISESITAIQLETADAVSRMQSGTDLVRGGVERAGQAGESLKMIVRTAQEVQDAVASIATAAQEQSTASHQISKAVDEISSLSATSSEGASQSAQAASLLSQRSEELMSLVGRFKVD